MSNTDTYYCVTVNGVWSIHTWESLNRLWEKLKFQPRQYEAENVDDFIDEFVEKCDGFEVEAKPGDFIDVENRTVVTVDKALDMTEQDWNDSGFGDNYGTETRQNDPDEFNDLTGEFIQSNLDYGLWLEIPEP